jgi:hypothetical protein
MPTNRVQCSVSSKLVLRGREVASRLAHNQKIVGSSPTHRNQISSSINVQLDLSSEFYPAGR